MFQIVVDSAANIPAELVKKYQIKMLSFVNYVDSKEHVCFDPSLSPEKEREKGKKYLYKLSFNGRSLQLRDVSITDWLPGNDEGLIGNIM